MDRDVMIYKTIHLVVIIIIIVIIMITSTTPSCRQTDGQIHTIVNTEDTLSTFQKFVRQPIIKDRSMNHSK